MAGVELLDVTVDGPLEVLVAGRGARGPPPPPPIPMGGDGRQDDRPMIGGTIGRVMTLIVTSTAAVALASPLPSSAVTVTTYVACTAASNVTPVATVICPPASMTNEDASAPVRL